MGQLVPRHAPSSGAGMLAPAALGCWLRTPVTFPTYIFTFPTCPGLSIRTSPPNWTPNKDVYRPAGTREPPPADLSFIWIIAVVVLSVTVTIGLIIVFIFKFRSSLNQSQCSKRFNIHSLFNDGAQVCKPCQVR